MKVCFGVDLFSFIESEACVPFNEESSVLLVQKVFLYFFFPLVISFALFSLVFTLGAPVIWLLVLLDRL